MAVLYFKSFVNKYNVNNLLCIINDKVFWSIFYEYIFHYWFNINNDTFTYFISF